MTDSHLSFNSLIGQDRAKDLLGRSWAKNKMAHAYLFRGPAGVGKKRAALTMAAYVNCHQPTDQDVCGNCPSCRKFRSGTHPDLLVIKPDGAMIKINQIRELKHAVTFPPFEARYRVTLLEDVQTMRREAANSLLKTLEEPPADNIFILTADEAGDLLPTIISRCQTIPFHALPYDRVAQALTAEGTLTEETAATLAAVSEGSLGRARLLRDNELLAFRQEVVESLLGLTPEKPEIEAVIFQLAEKAAELKENLTELFSLLKIWFRDLMLVATGSRKSLVVSKDIMSAIPAALERWNLQDLFNKISLIDRAEKELGRNCNRGLVCEVLFLGLI